MSKLIIAEKPSVAKSIASALGASSRADGFYEGSGLIVSWCVGHLVSPLDAGGYDERFKKWRYEDLPILPEPFRYVLVKDKEDAFQNLKCLMDREDVTELVNACDAGREGELIFRLAGVIARRIHRGHQMAHTPGNDEPIPLKTAVGPGCDAQGRRDGFCNTRFLADHQLHFVSSVSSSCSGSSSLM